MVKFDGRNGNSIKRERIEYDERKKLKKKDKRINKRKE